MSSSQDSSESGRVVAVISGRGGSGCTTIACALGTIMEKGRPSVALIDFDLLGVGAAELLWSGVPVRHLESGADYPAEPRAIFHAAGNPEDGIERCATQMSDAVARLDGMGRLVLLDAGGDPVRTLKAARLADLVLVIATTDPTGLKACASLRKALIHSGLEPRRIALVFNRSGEAGGLSAPEAQAVLGTPVIAVLPFAPEALFRAVRDGLRGSVAQTEGNWERALANLGQKVARLLEIIPAAPRTVQLVPGSGLRRLDSPTKEEAMRRLVSLLEQAPAGLDPSAMRRYVEESAGRVLEELPETQQLTRNDRGRATTQLVDEVLGYGVLEELVRDPSVTEIMVNGPGQIYVERNGRIQATEKTFLSATEIVRLVDRIVAPLGRRIDESSPMVDARLPDGSRLNAVIPPLAVDGPLVTIRRFGARQMLLEDLVAGGSLSPELAEFLRQSVIGRQNILFSGGAGSGKTTLLNALSGHIPAEERVVTIEDAAELRLQRRHVVRLEARPANVEGKGAVPIRELVRNALRMRPDRIVIGEVRGAEALDMLQAMNTGHDGSMATIHANSAREGLSRLETMCLMGAAAMPLRAIRDQMNAALDLIVHLERQRDGSRRVTEVIRLAKLGDGKARVIDVAVGPAAAGVPTLNVVDGEVS